MRLDKFLKVARIVRRRETARLLCVAGHVSVNGKVAKPMTDVEKGDLIRIRENAAERLYRVEITREYANEEVAKTMYSEPEGDAP